TSKYWGVLRILMISLRLILLSCPRVSLSDYHNMIAILEKYEHNHDFHQILDFVEASHIRYALTINPTVYVSHIRQFWSTARVETSDAETKILAIVDGQFSHQWKYLIYTIMQCLGPKSTGFNEFSSNIATALVCLATNRVYNFSKMIFDGTPTEPHHTPSPEAPQTSPTTHSSLSLPPVTTESLPTVIPFDTPSLKQYTRRTKIAQSLILPPVADEPASPLGDDSQCEACLTDSGFEADQDRANITKTSTLPSDSTPRVTSLAADESSMQQKLNELTALCTSLQRQQVKLLEDRERGGIAQSRKGAPIKGRSLDEGEEAAIERSTKKGSNDTKEMVNVLTSLDAATVLSSGVSVSISPITEVYVVEVPTGSGSIPTASPPGTRVPTGCVPTGSDVVPTASSIFTTAHVATPYTRKKEEEIERDAQRMNEQIARDAEIARIHAEEELQMMIDGLDRNNETVAKYLQEYHQFAADLPIGRRIELINDLVKYQDHYAKVLKYQTHQRKPLSRKQQKEFYMSVLKSHAGTSKYWGVLRILMISLRLILLFWSTARVETSDAETKILATVDDEPASPLGDDSQCEACLTDSGFEADQDRANITKTSTLPSDLTPRVTSLAADESSMQQKLNELTALCTSLQRQQSEMASKFAAQDLEISQLKARVKLLEDRERGGIAQSGKDAPIKGRSLDEGEEAAIERSTKKGSNDTKEMVNVLTSLDASTVLSSEVSVSISPITEVYVVEVPTGSGFIPTASPPGTGVPTGCVPTGSDVVPTASSIFTTAHVATPYTRKKGKEKMVKSETPKKKKLQEQIDVQKARHFKGMTLEEIKEKFDPVWKQFQDFIPICSKEEAERFKRKGPKLEQDSAKKVKTSEEVSKEKLKEMM
nr:hypothetical protein [Tanacetum cinerariifolium]